MIMADKQREGEDDILQDAINIANEILNVDEHLQEGEHEQLRTLIGNMREFADELEGFINQEEKARKPPPEKIDKANGSP
jgi:hypothetical protein